MEPSEETVFEGYNDSASEGMQSFIGRSTHRLIPPPIGFDSTDNGFAQSNDIAFGPSNVNERLIFRVKISAQNANVGFV
jgi:hypothetical protein